MRDRRWLFLKFSLLVLFFLIPWISTNNWRADLYWDKALYIASRYMGGAVGFENEALAWNYFW